MSSPLNKLADALPSFILQMQEIKTRQEYYEAITTYRQGMLAETINRNDLRQNALIATEQLRRVERGREEREDILEARGKYGELGARAIFPEATARQFPEGLPPEKEPEAKKPPAGDVAYFRRRRDIKVKELEKIDTDIEIMRKALDLAPGETPSPERTWFGFGEEKEKQPALNQWNKYQKTRLKIRTSLDRLRQQAEKEGIDIGLGAALDTLNIEDPLGMRR